MNNVYIVRTDSTFKFIHGEDSAINQAEEWDRQISGDVVVEQLDTTPVAWGED